MIVHNGALIWTWFMTVYPKSYKKNLRLDLVQLVPEIHHADPNDEISFSIINITKIMVDHDTLLYFYFSRINIEGF